MGRELLGGGAVAIAMLAMSGFFYYQNHIGQQGESIAPAPGLLLSGEEARAKRPEVKREVPDLTKMGELPDDCWCKRDDGDVKLYLQPLGQMTIMNDKGVSKNVKQRTAVSVGKEEPRYFLASDKSAPGVHTVGFNDVWSVACDGDSLYMATGHAATKWSLKDKSVKAVWSVDLPESRVEVVNDGEKINIECLPATVDKDVLTIPVTDKPAIKLSTKDGSGIK